MRSRLTFLIRLCTVVTALGATGHSRSSSKQGMTPVQDHASALQPSRREVGRDFYRVAFVGGEPAEVSIAGNGASNLELFIYNPDGHLICSSQSAGDRKTCAWLPAETSDFVIEVRNLGRQANEYRLWTN